MSHKDGGSAPPARPAPSRECRGGRWGPSTCPLPALPAQWAPSASAASFQGPTGPFRADGWQVWISMSMGRALPGKLVNKPPAPLGRLCRC